MMVHRRPLLLLTTFLPLFAPTLAQQQQRCQWATLRSATDSVLEALASSSADAPAAARPVFASSPALVYTQNGRAMAPGDPGSLLAGRPLLPALEGGRQGDVGEEEVEEAMVKVHSLIDQGACAAFFKVVVAATSNSTAAAAAGAADAGWYMYGSQVRFSITREAPRPTVARMDVVIAGGDDWQMEGVAGAGEMVGNLEREDWGALSRGMQDTRETLEAVAGRYLDLLGSGGEGDDEETPDVPWGRPCARLEGGVYTAVDDSEDCLKGLREAGVAGVTDREFVVDESVGAVSVLARDGSLGGAPSAFQFRVVEGQLRYVHQFAATSASW